MDGKGTPGCGEKYPQDAYCLMVKEKGVTGKEMWSTGK